MWFPEKKTNFPGKGDGEASSLLRQWVDKIFLPAIIRHVSASSRQHFPLDWEHARQQLEAHQREQKGVDDDKTAYTTSMALHYTLHPRFLHVIWQDVLQQLTLVENQIFHGAYLFFSNKNTKLQFTFPTLAESWDAFEASMNYALDPAYLNRDTI